MLFSDKELNFDIPKVMGIINLTPDSFSDGGRFISKKSLKVDRSKVLKEIKGLMPNPKTGTVTDDVATAINNAKAGQVRFRTDKNGIIHGSIGKVSFDAEKLQSNATALLDEIKKLKPASAKGVYIGNIALSSTMGPGIKINSAELV